MRAQSERFGTQIITETVAKLDLSNRPFKFWVEGEEEGEPTGTADTIIIATGASAKRLNLPGEEQYWQSGISACAVCDGAVPIFRNKPLTVIGGGDSAAEEAIFLTKYGSKVTVLVRRDKLRASPIMAKRLTSHPKVEIKYNTVAVECLGDGRLLNKLKIKDTVSGEISELETNGLFYAVGHEPATALVKGQMQLDEDGYIVTQPGTSYTSVKGVFAAGDVQDKKYRQAITSAGMFHRPVSSDPLLMFPQGLDALLRSSANVCWQKRRRETTAQCMYHPSHTPQRRCPRLNTFCSSIEAEKSQINGVVPEYKSNPMI
jgi:thioredoxin reductase (NADPH)